MAEIRLTDEQQKHLSNLLGKLAEDAGFRARFETDPRAVFVEYGLGSSLVAEGEAIEGLQATLTESEARRGHVDIHADYTPPHPDSFIPHIDSHGDYSTPLVEIAHSIKIKRPIRR